MEYSVKDLWRAILQVAGEASGLLRDMACTEKGSKLIRGETFRADLESESYIIDALINEGISGRFITEESGVIETRGDFTILIDPLDGSRNYANCIPWSSVSIAIAPKNAKSIDEVFVGVVHPVFYGNPLSFAGDECFSGGIPIEKKQESEGFLYVYIEHPEAAMLLAETIGILGRGLKIRSLGSAALEISYVAIGKGKAFIDLRPKLRNIDVAAGLGLARRCGGIYLGARGVKPFIGISELERINTIAVFSYDINDKIIEKISKGPLSSAGQRA